MQESEIIKEIEKIRTSAGLYRDDVYGITKKVNNHEIKDYQTLIKELRKFSKISDRYSESELKDTFYNLF